MKMTLQDLETAFMLGGWQIDVRVKDVETFWINTENSAVIRVGPAYIRDTQGRGRVGTYTYSINATPINVYSYESFYWHAFGANWDTSDPKPWTVHLG